ncbi:hypothetical protein ACTFIV_005377 [Dictyostelium citrinum]
MDQLNSNINEVRLKMALSYICNKSKQPPAKLQGIFSTFGIDHNKEFYYNYLDYKNYENNIKNISIPKQPQQQQQQQQKQQQNQPNHYHPYSLNFKKFKNHFQHQKDIQSFSDYITDNIIIIDNPVSKSQHYLKNHDTINKNNSNNNNCVRV